MTKKQLAKIHYQSRKVRYIEIRFSDFSHTLDIGPATDISGKDEIVTMDYDFTPEEDNGDKAKEVIVAHWVIENHMDKVNVNHTDTGIMIEWISGDNVKSSLFIPNERILHIHVDDPIYDYEKPAKEIINR